jgi:hypothetical protein
MCPPCTQRMDEIVIRAMQKWPDVPNVFGWLKLDRRGNWSVKTRSAAAEHERISNQAVIEFIGRNYAHDDRGRWFFQNGPQRVFVTLEYTPLVYRLRADGKSIETHCGVTASAIKAAWADDAGMILLETAQGAGVVLDRDLPAFLEKIVVVDGKPASDAAIEAIADGKTPGLALALGKQRIPLGSIGVAEVPRRFGFDPDPRPAPGQADC